MTVASVVMNIFGGGDGGGALDIIGSLLGGGQSTNTKGKYLYYFKKLKQTRRSVTRKYPNTSYILVVDRIDTNGVDAAITTINQASGAGSTDDLDVAMGTLMAYSGKFLRQIGLWAFEHATQTSSDSLSQSALPDKDTGTIANFYFGFCSYTQRTPNFEK